jgi:CRP-like cAMP-binding protein
LEELLKKIKSRIDLKPEAEAHFLSLAKTRSIPKGATLISEGQEVNKEYFVTEGCLRSYCIDKNGKEHTLQFAITNWWISDYIAIHTDEPATLTIESRYDYNVIEFEAKDLDTTLKLFPEYEPFQRELLERHVVSLHRRILNQLQLTASERYDLFLEQYPHIEQHCRNYHIASYLGITQESLSRIRSERVQ